MGHNSDSDVMGTKVGGVLQRQVQSGKIRLGKSGTTQTIAFVRLSRVGRFCIVVLYYTSYFVNCIFPIHIFNGMPRPNPLYDAATSTLLAFCSVVASPLRITQVRGAREEEGTSLFVARE